MYVMFLYFIAFFKLPYDIDRTTTLAPKPICPGAKYTINT